MIVSGSSCAAVAAAQPKSTEQVSTQQPWHMTASGSQLRNGSSTTAQGTPQVGFTNSPSPTTVNPKPLLDNPNVELAACSTWRQPALPPWHCPGLQACDCKANDNVKKNRVILCLRWSLPTQKTPRDAAPTIPEPDYPGHPKFTEAAVKHTASGHRVVPSLSKAVGNCSTTHTEATMLSHHQHWPLLAACLGGT